jgi:hypothetical protein
MFRKITATEDGRTCFGHRFNQARTTGGRLYADPSK